ncbi:MAG: biliverdin-producing heme oxygenase [Methylobacter sp.]
MPRKDQLNNVPNADTANQSTEHAYSILEALKEQTSTVHQAMHQHPMMSTLLSTSCRLPDYQVLLLAYHELYCILEHKLCKAASQLNLDFDYYTRLKSPWLDQDLNYFGLSPLARTIGDLGSMAITDIPTLIGVLYVVEGSTLGGQVIAKQLQDSLDITADRGGRFFFGYGADTAVMWQTFRRFAESVVEIEAEATVVAAAQATFAVFGQMLDIYYRRPL